MERRTETRRRFLQSAGSGAVVAIAGCTGDGRGSPTESTTDSSETEATNSTETETTRNSRTMNAVLHFSGTPDQQSHVIANAKNLLADDTTPIESVALVANGEGVSLLTTESTREKGVAALVEKGVSLLACQNSLRAMGLTEDDLLSGVETVPAGVGELVKRQDEGYAYVKVP